MKEIFIERREKILRIALKDNGKLKECLMEEESECVLPDQIYKGVVKNIVPGIKSAFIDIGVGRKTYMYLDNKFKNMKLKKGDEIIVQVVKEELGSKGAKVSNAITIPGKYSVLITLEEGINFSRKIADEAFKKSVLEEIKLPLGIGLMLRTKSAEVSMEVLKSEIEDLYNKYLEIVRKSTYSLKPGLIYDAGGILGRTLRDRVDESIKKLYIDSEDDMKLVKEYTEYLGLKIDINLHKEDRTLFDFHGIEKEILNLRNNKVFLKCGGYIVIDRTEAMYVIDVNSGKNVKDSSIENTAFTTNLEAASEITTQIKLRNLSGIILVDFIDMVSKEQKQKVLEILDDGFKNDKNKTSVYPFTELNLVQISRRRIGRAIYDHIEEACIECHGIGKRLKLSYINLLIKNEIKKLSTENINNIYIEVNLSYKNEITKDIDSFIENIDAKGKIVYVKFTSSEDYFKVETLVFTNQIQNVEQYKIYG